MTAKKSVILQNSLGTDVTLTFVDLACQRHDEGDFIIQSGQMICTYDYEQHHSNKCPNLT